MEDPPPLLFPFFRVDKRFGADDDKADSFEFTFYSAVFSNQLSEGFSPIHFLLDNLLSLNTLKSFGITFPYFDSVFHQTSESSDDESIFCNDHVFIRLAKFPNQGFENF